MPVIFLAARSAHCAIPRVTLYSIIRRGAGAVRATSISFLAPKVHGSIPGTAENPGISWSHDDGNVGIDELSRSEYSVTPRQCFVSVRPAVANSMPLITTRIVIRMIRTQDPGSTTRRIPYRKGEKQNGKPCSSIDVSILDRLTALGTNNLIASCHGYSIVLRQGCGRRGWRGECGEGQDATARKKCSGQVDC